MNRQRRVFQIDPPACRVLDQSADFALHLRRRERQPFVGARRRHPKRRGMSVAEIAPNRGSQLGEIMRPAIRVGEIRDAENAAHPPARLLPGRIRAKLDLDASHDGPDGFDGHALEHHLQVAHEKLNEPGTFSTLECEFLVVDDDAGHESSNRVIG